jgi:hypothetical protein
MTGARPADPEDDGARAAGRPRSPAARAVALSIRAAIPRVRDYAEESASPASTPHTLGSSSAQTREVLGALLLSARVLSAVADTCGITALCLVLAADGPHDRLPANDRADIGHSVLWQLVTCALDCIARPHSRDPVAPNIALASVNLVLVALSTAHLAPAEGRDAVGGAAGGAKWDGVRVQTTLLTSIVDRYARPGDVLASLLDLAVDAAAHRDAAHGSLTAVPASAAPHRASPFPPGGSPDLSPPADGENLVASVSRRFANVLLPRSFPSPSASTSMALPPAASPSASSVLAAFAARLPSPSAAIMFPPSMLWNPAPSPLRAEEGEAALPPVPPPTPSASRGPGHLVGSTAAPPEATASSTSARTAPGAVPTSAGAAEAKRPPSPSPGPSPGPSPHASAPRVIARAPTLLGEQALALVAVLCAPREDAATAPGTPSGAPAPAEGSSQSTRSVDNPYRTALLGLHDLPQRGSSDECAYSFSRLYESIGAWVDDPRGALVVYHLVVGNRRFRTFILARTDPDVLLVPLLAAMHARASPLSSTAPADVYIPAIIALVLSSDSGFCAAIDEITVPQSSLLWYEERARLSVAGVSLGGLVLLVCIRCVQQSVLSKRRVMESYLAATCMSIMGNVSSSVTGINNLAADRLVALTEFLGKRRRKAALTAAHEKEMPLSPPPVRNGASSPRLRSVHTMCSLPSGALPLGQAGGVDARRLSTVSTESNASSLDGSTLMGVHNGEHAVAAPPSTDRERVAFRLCGVEASEGECEETLTDLLGTLLEVIASILRSRSNVSVNRHLMYSLLHREAVFDSAHVGDVSARSRVVVACIRGAISFFSKRLDQPADAAAAPAKGVNGSGAAPAPKTLIPSSDRVGLSLSGAGVRIRGGGSTPAVSAVFTSGGPGVSVDRVFDVIDRHARMLPPDALHSLPELRFTYCQARTPRDFFLPYAWVLAMRDSPLQWDPAQFPDAAIPLAKSVFHPPRPQHGSGAMPALA